MKKLNGKNIMDVENGVLDIGNSICKYSVVGEGVEEAEEKKKEEEEGGEGAAAAAGSMKVRRSKFQDAV